MVLEIMVNEDSNGDAGQNIHQQNRQIRYLGRWVWKYVREAAEYHDYKGGGYRDIGQ